MPRLAPATNARRIFEGGLDSLADALDTLAALADRGAPEQARRAFRTTRVAYKRVEALLSVYAPDLAAGLNGPLEEGGDDAQPLPFGTPAALQVIDAALFPAMPDSARTTVHQRARSSAAAVRRFRALTRYLNVSDPAVLDAARREIARVSTLDLAGVDLERNEDAIVEAAAALDGVRALTRASVSGRGLDTTLRNAVSYLRAHSDFVRLDRLTFITACAEPAAQAVAAARAELGPAPGPVRRAWRTEAASVFDRAAFDASAYAAPLARTAYPSTIALGERLFHDTRLSGPGTRSCATCHDPAHAFTDGRRVRTALAAPSAHTVTAHPARNTPTLTYSGLQPVLFADERATSLEEQAADVMASPDEMHGSATIAADRLQHDTTYRTAFAAAFQLPPAQAITSWTVRRALAAYVRSLAAFDSRFDRAARGDTSVLTRPERHGFTLFMGKARCGTCHFAPLFNGTLPPRFITSEPEIIGVPERARAQHARLDPDPGRGAIDGVASHRFAFKVPTLRNVAATAPYMHNGAYRTLEEVLDFYNAGGGSAVGADVPYQTLPRRPLRLTDAERRDIIAFLGALTDAPPVPAPTPPRYPSVTACSLSADDRVARLPSHPSSDIP
jgi:cytochrome c peroxidase